MDFIWECMKLALYAGLGTVFWILAVVIVMIGFVFIVWAIHGFPNPSMPDIDDLIDEKDEIRLHGNHWPDPEDTENLGR